MRSSSAEAALLSTLLFPLLVSAVGNIDCSQILLEGVEFDLSELGGARSVLHSVVNTIGDATTYTNTTYMMDVCRPLKKTKFNKCPNGTRVCGITHLIKPAENKDEEEQIIPFAGDYETNGGGSLNAKWELLSRSKSHTDSEKEGLRVEMNGGSTQEDGKTRQQKTIVEFICDKDKTGLENLWDPEAIYPAETEPKTKRDEPVKPVAPVKPASSLQYVRLDTAGDADILRLEWHTKHACERAVEEEKPKSSSWGWFTWFLIIVFLTTATYLIGGSYVNYSKYGARGWELLPHADTLRDVPYVLKDWSRRVVNGAQSGGSRGGYAAV